MKKSKLVNAVLALIAIGTAIYLYRETKKRQKRRLIADAGYETAYDIHFPLRINRPGRPKTAHS